MTMPDIEGNKAIVRRYFVTFDAGDLIRIHEALARNYGERLEGQTAEIEVVSNRFQPDLKR
jgi:hypothetical protein